MVKTVINYLNREISGLHEAAYLLALFALLSQVLALVRDRLLAATFGATHTLDIYYASFRIPDILFTLVTALVSVSVIVPFLTRRIDSLKESKEFINSIYTVFLLIILVLAIVTFFLVEPLSKILFSDLMRGPEGNQLILITRIMLLQPIFLAVSSLYSGIVQVYRRFFIYALSPLFYNLGIIIGIKYFYFEYGIQGLAFGVVLGSIMHLLIQMPSVRGHKLLPKITTNIKWNVIREVLSLSIPRTIALTSQQIINLVLLALAGTFVLGSVSVFSLSYGLQSVPLAIIGVSYSLAAFPTLSRLYVDGKIDVFLSHIVKAARHIIFWSMPVMVLFVVLRAQIVRTILGSGAFDWNDTRLTAAALAIFAVSVLAQSLSLLLIRGYYSAGETKRPVFINIFSMIFTVCTSIFLIGLYKNNIGFRFYTESLLRVEDLPGTIVLMLPLAYSLGQILNASLLWISFDRKFKCFSDSLWKVSFHSLGASVLAGYVAYLSLQFLDDILDINTLFGIFTQGFISGIVGILVGAVILVVLDNQEIKTVWRTLHLKIWKAKIVAVEETDL